MKNARTMVLNLRKDTLILVRLTHCGGVLSLGRVCAMQLDDLTVFNTDSRVIWRKVEIRDSAC